MTQLVAHTTLTAMTGLLQTRFGALPRVLVQVSAGDGCGVELTPAKH